MRNSPVLVPSTLVRRTSLVAAAALAAVALAACGASDDTTTVADDPGAETTSAAPSSSAPATPTETPSTTAAAPATTSAAPDPNALITLDSPTDGTTVSGSFDAKGTANSPEANVPWVIKDASGKKVLDGYFTAEGWMDKLYPYAGSVDVSKLPAGSYTFRVAVDDPSGGEGKAPEHVDRSITVQ